MPSFDFDSYAPSPRQMARAKALVRLLRTCDERGVAVSLLGGYGLDALYGKLTRDHHDFDALVKSEASAAFAEILAELGYQFAPHRSDPGRKDVYVHKSLRVAMEFSAIDSAKLALWGQQFHVALDFVALFPGDPNGRLLDYPVRAATVKGVEEFDRMQAERARQEGLGPPRRKDHHLALLARLKTQRRPGMLPGKDATHEH